MKTVTLLISLTLLFSTFCSCSGVKISGEGSVTGSQISKIPLGGRKIRVCITTYSKYDDHWTAAGKTSTMEPLEAKKTCAVDPSVIPYHSLVHIPELGLELRAVDTGSAVKSRRASRKRGEPDTPVVDIYFHCRENARAFANRNPYFVDAYIK